MANDFLSAAGGFGEMFFKTLQSERDRQDKLNQQQQEFSQKSREMNLINAWKQKMFDYGVQTDKLKAEGDYSKIDPNTAPENMKPNIFSGKDFPNLLDPNSSYIPNNEIPKTEKPTDTYESFSEKGYWNTNGKDGKPEWIPNPLYKENPSGSGSNNKETSPQPETTPYINFGTVEEMIRNYNQRGDYNGDIPSGVANTTDGTYGKVMSPQEWRIKANEELDKVMKGAKISQEVFDKIWEVSGIKEGDDAVTKRKKLKNVLDQQPNLNDYQRRALYLGAEVRTR